MNDGPTRLVQFRARPEDLAGIERIQRKLRALGVSATVTDAIKHAIVLAQRAEDAAE